MGLSLRSRPNTTAGPVGLVLMVLGLLGLVLGLCASVLAWLLVDGGLDSLEESLSLTDEALVAVAETVGVAQDVVVATSSGLESVAAVVGDVGDALMATEAVLAEADVVLGETVPSSIDAVRRPLAGLITSTDVVTGILASLPFVGDAAVPDPPPGESLRLVDQELAALADRLRDPSARLGAIGDEFAQIRGELATTGAVLASMTETVDTAEQVLAGYETAASRASQIVDEEIDDLGRRRMLGLALVALFTVVVGVGSAGLVIIGRSWPSPMADGA